MSLSQAQPRARIPARTRLRRARRQLRRIANVGARRSLPVTMLPTLAVLRSSIGRRRPGRLTTSRNAMRFIVGESVPAAEIDALADAHLRRDSWRVETRWRPQAINHQEVVGLEHLQGALREGKGCLLSFIHHGDYIGHFASIARAGQSTVALGAASLFDPDAPLWHEQHRRAVSSAPGVSVLSVVAGSAGLREQLLQGQAAAVALDFPGHTPTHLFGRDLLLSSGGTRVAFDLDAPVVAVTSRRHDSREFGGATVELSEPWYPKDFSGVEELHATLAQHFERAIRAWPEATEEPLRMQKSHLVKAPTTYRATA